MLESSMDGVNEPSNHFAVHGLCALLSNSSSVSMHDGSNQPCEDRSVTVNSLLQHAFQMPLHVRKPFYDSLYTMFQDFAHEEEEAKSEETVANARGDACPPQRRRVTVPLLELLLKQAAAHFFVEASSTHCLAVLASFEPIRSTSLLSTIFPQAPPAPSRTLESTSLAGVRQYSLHIRLREILPELMRCLAHCSSLCVKMDDPCYRTTNAFP